MNFCLILLTSNYKKLINVNYIIKFRVDLRLDSNKGIPRSGLLSVKVFF